MYLGKLYRPHCDLTIIIFSKGNHPKMALIQGSEVKYVDLIYPDVYILCQCM